MACRTEMCSIPQNVSYVGHHVVTPSTVHIILRLTISLDCDAMRLHLEQHHKCLQKVKDSN